MTVDPKLFYRAREVEPETLAAESPEDVAESLRGWLELWETRDYVDDELLSDVGILIGESGHAGQDSRTWSWLRLDPTERRLEICAGFFQGYWRSAESPDASVVNELENSLARLDATGSAYAGTLLALYTAVVRRDSFLPADAKERLRGVLLQHLARLRERGLHRGVVAYLQHIEEGTV